MNKRSKKDADFNAFMCQQVVMTHNEIADKLGLTKGEVRVIYNRALRKLRRSNFIRHMNREDYLEE